MKSNKSSIKQTSPNKNKDDLQASRMKTIYTQLITQQAQKLRPFGQTEERFRWQNSKVTNHMSSEFDISKCRISRIKKKDNLQGGIGSFFNNKESIKERRHRPQNKSIVHKKRSQSPFANINSQRVIYPDENCEGDYSNHRHKKFIKTSEIIKHPTNGSITSLINKTPMQVNYKTRKICNKSFDSSMNRDVVIRPKIRVYKYKFNGSTSSLENGISGRKHFASNQEKFVY